MATATCIRGSPPRPSVCPRHHKPLVPGRDILTCPGDDLHEAHDFVRDPRGPGWIPTEDRVRILKGGQKDGRSK